MVDTVPLWPSSHRYRKLELLNRQTHRYPNRGGPGDRPSPLNHRATVCSVCCLGIGNCCPSLGVLVDSQCCRMWDGFLALGPSQWASDIGYRLKKIKEMDGAAVLAIVFATPNTPRTPRGLPQRWCHSGVTGMWILDAENDGPFGTCFLDTASTKTKTHRYRREHRTTYCWLGGLGGG